MFWICSQMFQLFTGKEGGGCATNEEIVFFKWKSKNELKNNKKIDRNSEKFIGFHCFSKGYFYSYSWFLVGFHEFFIVFRWFLMVFGPLFPVVSWFLYINERLVPTVHIWQSGTLRIPWNKLYLSPTVSSRPCRPKAGYRLVITMIYILCWSVCNEKSSLPPGSLL